MDAEGAGAPGDPKATLRDRMRAARRALDPAVGARLSEAIAARLFALETWASARTVHAYIGSVEGEVATRGIVTRALAEGKRVAAPRAVWSPRALESRALASLDDLVATPRGLREPPADAPLVDPAAIDLVLVPGVAFDRRGHRLGYGAGFYDRFLALLAAPKIGLAFNLQVIDRVPVTPTDVPVDWVLTERETIACRAEREAAERDAMP